MTAERTAIVIFVRAPSRERKRLGLQGAGPERVHESLFAATLRTVERARPGLPTFILADGTRDLVRRFPRAALRHGWLPQRGASFEDRLLGGLESVAALGFDRLVVIGTDTPGLSRQDLADASLGSAATATIGPSRDGGFYLLGIRTEALGCLRGLPWHRADVARCLARRLSVSGTFVRHLGVREDVDDARTVRRLFHVLAALSRRHARSPVSIARTGRRRPPRMDPPRTVSNTGPTGPRAPPHLPAA